MTRHSIAGILINATTYDAVVEQVISAAKTQSPLAVSATAVHGVMEGALSVEHAQRLNDFDILTPDGQPVRWALNLLYKTKLRDRVYGPLLTLKILERAEQDGLPVYFYGSTPEVLEQLEQNLSSKYPALKLAGMEASKFQQIDSEAQNEIAMRIQKSGAAIVFVGLGCPRQEIFTWAMRKQVSMPLLAVGAAFDFHAGLSREAPVWMQRWGLQWLHRLAQNPRRLWHRYLILSPRFVSRVVQQKLGRRYPIPPGAAYDNAKIPG